VGSRETVGRDGASPLGVGYGGGVEENREERVLAERWPRAPPPPCVQLGNDKGKSLPRFIRAAEREGLCRSPLGRFCMEERKKEGKTWG
jgi:hypothetical protein